jgi:hypothetical protein
MLLLAAGFHRLSAAPEFDYDANCARAYKAYLALRPAEGDARIREALQDSPDNLMAVYISDYGEFFTLLFNGDPARRDQYIDNQTERQRRISTASDSNPWKRYCLAGLQLHAALIHGRLDQQFRAATAFRRSFLLLKENASRFPQFGPNAMLYGLEEAIAGSIPQEYAWISALFGMKADFGRGLSRLSGWLNANQDPVTPFREEALICESYLRFYLASEKSTVWNRIGSDQQFDIHGNLLRCFVRANLALAFRKAEVAQSTLKHAYTLPGAADYPVFDFENGSALLLKLDPAATSYFSRFVSRNKGLLYTKDALQQMALAYYIRGDQEKAQKFRSLILQHGSMLTDADRQAQRFAKSDQWPHPLLLTARLLIDGGYATQALDRLRSTNASAFSTTADRLEYDFRLGRALEDCGNHAEAVQAYQRVINAGSNRPEYFAARSALQMAGIYEQHGQKEYAKRYYKICLSMRHHDFQNSLDQQAKAGLSRLQ